MRRRTRQTVEEPGQDSFLDIVANLVGILIILVMIVGAQAKDAMLQTDKPMPTTGQAEVEKERNAASAARYELQRLVEKTKKQGVELAYRRAERDRMLVATATIENALEQRRQELSLEQRRAHDLQKQIAAARRRQEDLKSTRDLVERSTAPVRVLKHRPTPLAKTVFGQELHFRLKRGRVVFVPLDELLELFTVEAKQKVWKLRQAPSITETVGPVRGFRLKYTLKKESYAASSRPGLPTQERVVLDRFVLVPVRDDLGEPVDQALRPQSQFHSMLHSFNPNEVTVTIWVYPDSFENYRLLKEDLFKLGFLTASRPLSEGQPISGSPEGTRSAAQ